MNKSHQIMYQNVLIYTKQYLNMIRFLILVSNLTFWDFWIFWNFGDTFSNIYLKNDIFETCFRQSAKGKMTAWDVR